IQSPNGVLLASNLLRLKCLHLAPNYVRTAAAADSTPSSARSFSFSRAYFRTLIPSQLNKLFPAIWLGKPTFLPSLPGSLSGRAILQSKGRIHFVGASTGLSRLARRSPR